MQLGERIQLLKERVKEHYLPLESPHPACVLFFSLSSGVKQANVFTVSGKSFDEAWTKGVNRLPLLFKQDKQAAHWLRVDMVTHTRQILWKDFLALLWEQRRNFSRYGLALNASFQTALLEQECNANSLFYGENKEEKGEFNLGYFKAYSKQRFGKEVSAPHADNKVFVFSATGAFCDQDGQVSLLPGVEDFNAVSGTKIVLGLNAGRRQTDELSHDILDEVIRSSSQFLARQMKEDGEFIYGYLPGFAKRLTGYNRVRHAGTLFALLETLAHTSDESLRPAIDAGITALAERMVRSYVLPNKEEAAFLIEADGSIKLGGNGVALVALSRWQELSGDDKYYHIMQKLGVGIAHMQKPDTGTFVHVLDADNLAVKEEMRTVYYDGEALFGLMRLYGLSKDERWLTVAEKAFKAFIALEHWKHHDHWLSYAANELTLYKPEDEYFQFGLSNAVKHSKFILERETTYPTLLELCMAAEKMIRRLEQMPNKQHLLQEFDLAEFRQSTQYRAKFLLNGYFYPETVMYFPKPYQLLGGFFIRHHGFRTRIDDVGHYLCGLVAYDALFTK